MWMIMWIPLSLPMCILWYVRGSSSQQRILTARRKEDKSAWITSFRFGLRDRASSARFGYSEGRKQSLIQIPSAPNPHCKSILLPFSQEDQWKDQQRKRFPQRAMLLTRHRRSLLSPRGSTTNCFVYCSRADDTNNNNEGCLVKTEQIPRINNRISDLTGGLFGVFHLLQNRAVIIYFSNDRKNRKENVIKTIELT